MSILQKIRVFFFLIERFNTVHAVNEVAHILNAFKEDYIEEKNFFILTNLTSEIITIIAQTKQYGIHSFKSRSYLSQTQKLQYLSSLWVDGIDTESFKIKMIKH